MGFFSRGRSGRNDAVATSDPSVFIGRKFRSSLTVDDCLSNFAVVREQCYRTSGPVVDVEWNVPAAPEGFTSSQGAMSPVPPMRAVATELVGGGYIYLAIWNGMVSYGDGSGSSGPPCEMWFVPPGFDTSPIQIAGAWKMRDSSLSSIGYVESPLWGGP